MWLLFLCWEVYLCVRIYTEPETELAHPPHLTAIRYYLALSALAIVALLLTEVLGRPPLLGRLYSYRSRDFWPKLTHWPLILAKDSVAVKALLMQNIAAMSYAFLAAILAFAALGAGASRLVCEVLSIAALACVIYIRLRSHFSWEKKYLK